MKYLLHGVVIIMFSLLSFGSASCAEGDGAMPSGKAINSICPVTGKAVDPTLAPVVVVIGKGDKAKRVVIGIAVASAADTIKSNPQKYVNAAKINSQAE